MDGSKLVTLEGLDRVRAASAGCAGDSGYQQPAAPAPCRSPCRGRGGKPEGGMGSSPASHIPEEGCKWGHMGLATPGRAAPLCEPREKGSECLELFGAGGNELKTMSSSVNIYQMNESRGLKR